MNNPHPIMMPAHKECPSCHDNGIIYIKAGIPNEARPCPKKCEAWKWLLSNGKVRVCQICGRVVEKQRPCHWCKKWGVKAGDLVLCVGNIYYGKCVTVTEQWVILVNEDPSYLREHPEDRGVEYAVKMDDIVDVCPKQHRGRPVNPDSKAQRKINKDVAEVADRRSRCGLHPDEASRTPKLTATAITSIKHSLI